METLRSSPPHPLSQMRRQEEGGRNPHVEVEENPKTNLLMDLRPPTLEEAGLEDCALPADSILQAFSIAANSLTSRLDTAEEYEETRVCVDEDLPVETFEKEADTVTAAKGEEEPAMVEKKGGTVTGGDDAVVRGGNGRHGGITAGDNFVMRGDGWHADVTAGDNVAPREGNRRHGDVTAADGDVN